jgi:excisionase family DNA binding protein
MAEIVVLTAEQLRDVVRDAVRDALKRAQSDDLVGAAESGMPARTFRRLVRTGKLEGRKVGREYLVRREALDRYLAERAAPPLSSAPTTPDDPIERALAAGRLRVIRK